MATVTRVLVNAVSSIKTSVINISKLAVSNTNTTKLKLDDLAYKSRTKLQTTISSSLVTLASNKTKLSDLVQTTKLKTAYSLGVFFTETNKIAIKAIARSKLAAAVDYVKQTKLFNIVQPGKAVLQLSYKKTALDISTRKTALEFNYLSKLKATYILGAFIIAWGRIQQDAVLAVERIILQFAKNLGEEVGVSDRIDVLSGYDRVTIDSTITSDSVSIIAGSRINDTSYIFESVSITSGYNYNTTDFITPTDDFDGITSVDDDQVALIGNNVFDTVSITDSINTISNYTTVFTDTALIGDSVSVLNSYNREVIDNVATLDDLVSAENQYYLNTSDAFFITDVVNTLKLYSRSNIDTVDIADSIDTSSSFIVNSIDNLSTTDSVATSVIKNTSDIVTSNDSAYFYIEPIVIDQTSITDQINIFSDYIFNTQDTVTTTDDYYGLANIDDDQIAFVGKSILDTIGILDNVNTISDYSSTVLETAATISDVIIPSLSILLFYYDTVSITDNINTTSNYIPVFTDTALINDSISRLSSYNPEVIDNVATLDDLVSAENQYYLNTSDAFFTTDVVSTLKLYSRSNTDNVGITDSIDTLSLFIGISTDSLTTTDSVTILNNYLKDIADVVTGNDTAYFYIEPTVIDQTSITDQINIVSYYIFNTQDTVTTTDDYYGLANIDDDQIAFVGKSILDTIGILDNVNTISDYSSTVLETATISDTIIPFLLTTLFYYDTATLVDSMLVKTDKSTIDSISLSDISTAGVGKSAPDFIAVSGYIQVLSHDYTLGDYVDLGYTGSIILEEAG